MKKLWRKLFPFKHDFDLENPTYKMVFDYKISIFKCKKCDKTLMLELWQMKSLPRCMARGCVK